MQIEIIKSNGRQICRYPNCSSNPKYIKSNGNIIKDTTCAAISMKSAAGWNISYFCRECIDKIYIEMKMALNSNLWVFE